MASGIIANHKKSSAYFGGMMWFTQERSKDTRYVGVY